MGNTATHTIETMTPWQAKLAERNQRIRELAAEMEARGMPKTVVVEKLKKRFKIYGNATVYRILAQTNTEEI